jgi:hypothetical protein
MGYCEKKLTNMARLTKINKDFNYIGRLWRNLCKEKVYNFVR